MCVSIIPHPFLRHYTDPLILYRELNSYAINARYFRYFAPNLRNALSP